MDCTLSKISIASTVQTGILNCVSHCLSYGDYKYNTIQCNTMHVCRLGNLPPQQGHVRHTGVDVDPRTCGTSAADTGQGFHL